MRWVRAHPTHPPAHPPTSQHTGTWCRRRARCAASRLTSSTGATSPCCASQDRRTCPPFWRSTRCAHPLRGVRCHSALAWCMQRRPAWALPGAPLLRLLLLLLPAHMHAVEEPVCAACGCECACAAACAARCMSSRACRAIAPPTRTSSAGAASLSAAYRCRVAAVRLAVPRCPQGCARLTRAGRAGVTCSHAPPPHACRHTTTIHTRTHARTHTHTYTHAHTHTHTHATACGVFIMGGHHRACRR
jgi:hypothetical protein